MRDPFFWSFPLGRIFGITIRINVWFPVVALAMVLRVAFAKNVVPGSWIDVAILTALFFVSVLCHEFGHCIAARWMDGDATEITMWPLGGLAAVDLPHEPRPHFVTAAGGPAVNLLFCAVCALLLAFLVEPSYQPPWNPLTPPYRGSPPEVQYQADWKTNAIGLYTWDGQLHSVTGEAPVLLARLFWVNWALLLLNVLLVCFPLDGGRMLQSILWPSLGYRQATWIVICAGFVATVLVGLAAIVFNEILILCLAAFIYNSCRTQLIILETGGEEGLFGYDFSQGYTSLEREQPHITAKKKSWWKSWREKRTAEKLKRELEQREAEDRRLDELLDKLHRLGESAMTDEERRFMKRVSDRYRNRN